ncbi:uncharacterized protein PSFLO_02651 [Pseudozyma flocculosa]|uniref:Uncharacterized protein n=1 Tax=Pseudozyma flocculosa TaxID=84751 RepID=A0A5C3F144_9BASI|nr:uncharacterized protein PSFLO_02651 [Pseudozyma flocculosa]
MARASSQVDWAQGRRTWKRKVESALTTKVVSPQPDAHLSWSGRLGAGAKTATRLHPMQQLLPAIEADRPPHARLGRRSLPIAAVRVLFRSPKSTPSIPKPVRARGFFREAGQAPRTRTSGNVAVTLTMTTTRSPTRCRWSTVDNPPPPPPPPRDRTGGSTPAKRRADRGSRGLWHVEPARPRRQPLDERAERAATPNGKREASVRNSRRSGLQANRVPLDPISRHHESRPYWTVPACPPFRRASGERGLQASTRGDTERVSCRKEQERARQHWRERDREARPACPACAPICKGLPLPFCLPLNLPRARLLVDVAPSVAPLPNRARDPAYLPVTLSIVPSFRTRSKVGGRGGGKVHARRVNLSVGNRIWHPPFASRFFAPPCPVVGQMTCQRTRLMQIRTEAYIHMYKQTYPATSKLLHHLGMSDVMSAADR